MNELWNENLKLHLKQFVPLISICVFIIIFNIPLYPFVSYSIRPYVGIICTYFWLTHRSYSFGVFSVYLIGFLEDIISSTPFGLNIFTMLLLYVFTQIVYKFIFNKPFIIIWYGFCITLALTLLCKWLLLSFYYRDFLPISTLLFSFLTSICFYPIFSIINIYIHQQLIEDEK